MAGTHRCPQSRRVAETWMIDLHWRRRCRMQEIHWNVAVCGVIRGREPSLDDEGGSLDGF